MKQGRTIRYTSAAAGVDTPAAALMAPYVGWTAFAGWLTTEIVRRNG
jgi:tryptophan-rich sensory protein